MPHALKQAHPPANSPARVPLCSHAPPPGPGPLRFASWSWRRGLSRLGAGTEQLWGLSRWGEVLIPGPPLPALHVTAVPRGPPAHPADAESGETGMRGGGSGVGPGWGHPHSVLLRPLCSLPWASPAPSPSSLAPWTPPRVLRVSREVPAALSLLPVRTPAPAPSLCRNTRYCYSRCATATAGVHTGDGPGLSSLPSAPRAFEHGPDAEGDTSSRHDQRGAPGKGWAQVAGELPGLPSLGLHSRPLCLRRATEVACGPHLTLLLARVCPP